MTDRRNVAKRIALVVLAVLIVSVAVFSVPVRFVASGAEGNVHCYIVVEPDREWYYYGETITMIAKIEVNNAEDAATPTDLKYNGEWSIVWQRNDHDAQDGYWYDVGEGDRYQYEISYENCGAWWRFVATWNENE